MEYEVKPKKHRWWDKPVVVTTQSDVFRKGDMLQMSGLTRSCMLNFNGEYVVTKVRRNWSYWYSPIFYYARKMTYSLRMFWWKVQELWQK